MALAGPDLIAPYRLVKFALVGGKANAAWLVQPVELASVEPMGQEVLFTGPPHRYTIICFATVGVKPYIFTATCTILAGAPIPPPVPPGPTPVPPDPAPEPAPVPPAPIGAPGLRVLMVYESEDLSRYPPAQLYVLTDTNLRTYLNGACAKLDNIPEYRVWDKDVDTTKESALWQEAMKRPRGTLPAILVSNGTTGYDGPLPMTSAEAIALIQKYDPAINPPASAVRRKKAA
jgi:hypothetical protein